MFGKKKQISTIDKDQLELIQYAQKRIKQKKGVYIHFIVFLVGAVFLILANTVLGIGEGFKIAGLDWFVYAVIAWLIVFVFHFVNVYITKKFMGKAWEQRQLEKLVNQQQQRIDKLKQGFLKEEIEIAKSKAYNEAKANPEVLKKKSKQLTIIVAAGEQNEIGKNNDLIWHLSDDLKRFKSLTNGHHIIMGRKTFESFPKPLPNRTHIVITTQKDYKAPKGVIIVNTLEDAIDAAKNDAQPFIIGGGEIYKQTLTLADRLEITRVHATFNDADTFFPEIDLSKWEEISRTTHSTDQNHAHTFSFITYLRK